MKLIDWLINKAKETPYFHLPDYMNRYWLVPYNEVIWRTTSFTNSGIPIVSGDGTGLVNFLERPIAWIFQKFNIAMRIHEILRSDIGREPHDHPWWYLTIILKGGYWEERYNDKGQLISSKYHGPGSVLFRPANSWHKLIIFGNETATTLFITGKKSQEWGFNVDGVKINWREYLS